MTISPQRKSVLVIAIYLDTKTAIVGGWIILVDGMMFHCLWLMASSILKKDSVYCTSCTDHCIGEGVVGEHATTFTNLSSFKSWQSPELWSLITKGCHQEKLGSQIGWVLVQFWTFGREVHCLYSCFHVTLLRVNLSCFLHYRFGS